MLAIQLSLEPRRWAYLRQPLAWVQCLHWRRYSCDQMYIDHVNNAVYTTNINLLDYVSNRDRSPPALLFHRYEPNWSSANSDSVPNCGCPPACTVRHL